MLGYVQHHARDTRTQISADLQLRELGVARDTNTLHFNFPNGTNTSIDNGYYTDRGVSFADLLTAIGSTPATVYVNSLVTLTGATAAPSTIHLVPMPGGGFTAASAVTLTVNGTIEPGIWFQWIFGSLVVAYSDRVEGVPSEWYAPTGDGSTDDTTAIQAAMDAAYTANIPLLLRAATYRVTSISRVVDSTKNLRIKGSGMSATTLRKIGATTTPILDISSTDASPPPYLENFCEIKDLRILGLSYAHHGIQLTRMALCKFDRVNIVDCDYGVNNVGSLLNNWLSSRFVSCNRGFVTTRATGASTVYSNVVNFYGCRFKGNSVFGLDAGGGNNIYLAGCEFDNNGENTNTGTGAVIVRATTDDEFGFGILNFDTCWFEGNAGRTFQAETGCGAFIAIKNSQFVGNETGGSARAIYVDGARGVYLDNICAGGPNDVVEITANVSKSDVRDSTIATLTDNCENKNHFNLNDGTGIARGFSTDLFLSRSAKIKIAVSNTFGHEHQIYNDGSNRLNFESYNDAAFRFDGGPMILADGNYNETHLAFGNMRIWKDSNLDIRAKSSAPGSATDGDLLNAVVTEQERHFGTQNGSGVVKFGSGGLTANFAYSAKDNTTNSFTVTGFIPHVAVPFKTFTIGGNTYTIVRSVGSTLYVSESISGEASSGTLTNVPYMYVGLQLDANHKTIIGATGSGISAHYSATTTWNPPDIVDGAVTSTTITVPGATLGDTVAVGFDVAVPAGALLTGAITATDTVTATLFNKTGANLNLGNGTIRADVWRH